ncbi:MAG: histidine phosphatase family protein, partial [Acidimicrobiales bacterium]
REVGLGEWEEGGFRRRAAARDPEFLEFVAAGRWEVIPGAERDDDFRARVRGALDAVVAAHPGESIAVVCHSGVINAWLADHFGSVRSVVATIENTSITTLRAGLRGPNAMNSEGRWLLAGVNDQHHLGDPLLRSPATQAAPGRSSAGASSLASSGETPK